MDILKEVSPSRQNIIEKAMRVARGKDEQVVAACCPEYAAKQMLNLLIGSHLCHSEAMRAFSLAQAALEAIPLNMYFRDEET